MDRDHSSQRRLRQRRDGEFLPGDYRLVGLAGFAGDRWIIDFDGELEARTRSVTLGHSQPDSLVAVCTAGRAENDSVRGVRHWTLDWSREFAFAQLLTLLIWDCPSDLDEDGRRRYSRGEGAYAEAHTENLSEWESTMWSLDGRPLPARGFRFGDSWVGVTDGDAQRRISVLVRGSDPVATELDLVEVSSVDYGWDFTKPFTMSSYRPSVAPDYVEALQRGPESARSEHREVMSREPRPIRYSRDGVSYRFEVREVERPDSD